jgi:hypothetical protein
MTLRFGNVVYVWTAENVLEMNRGELMNRTTVESNIPIPDLWHVVQRMGFDTEDGKAVLETWHLAHELRKSIVHIDRLIVSLREAKRE